MHISFIIFFNQTPIFKYHVVGHGSSKNTHHIDTCFTTIGLHLQFLPTNVYTIDSIVNAIRGIYHVFLQGINTHVLRPITK